MALNGRALTATGVGVLFIWSGIRGWSVLATIGDVIRGKQPSQSVLYPLEVKPDSPPATQGMGDAGSAVPTTGLAAIAMQYVGHKYVFGSAPGPNAERPWDCSSFINYVVGVKAKKAIPGYKPGKYKGTTHGPPTGVWATWPGMDTIKRSQVQAGDILLWLGHMGMATGPNTMISALNPAKGTKTQTIDSGVGRGPLVRIGRLR